MKSMATGILAAARHLSAEDESLQESLTLAQPDGIISYGCFHKLELYNTDQPQTCPSGYCD